MSKAPNLPMSNIHEAHSVGHVHLKGKLKKKLVTSRKGRRWRARGKINTVNTQLIIHYRTLSHTQSPPPSLSLSPHLSPSLPFTDRLKAIQTSAVYEREKKMSSC